jgi:hypothetical protein
VDEQIEPGVDHAEAIADEVRPPPWRERPLDHGAGGEVVVDVRRLVGHLRPISDRRRSSYPKVRPSLSRVGWAMNTC